MSNVARLTSAREQRNPYAGCSYLGPALVIAAAPARLEVELATGARVEACAALGFGYEPRAGDSVVVLGNEAGHYLVGVLASQGTGSLTFPGDLAVEASGTLRLRGVRGLEIEGPAMAVRVGKLSLLADAVTERFRNLRQRVVERLSVQAGETHTVVEGSSYTRAESATLLTKEKVSINGKAIHLG